MTSESALVFAVVGAWLAIEVRADSERIATVFWHRAPAWLRRASRRGDGPLGVMSLAWEVYGLGMTVFGLLVAVGGDSRLANGVFALWLGGGIIVLAVIDLVLSTRRWLTSRRPAHG